MERMMARLGASGLVDRQFADRDAGHERADVGHRQLDPQNSFFTGVRIRRAIGVDYRRPKCLLHCRRTDCRVSGDARPTVLIAPAAVGNQGVSVVNVVGQQSLHLETIVQKPSDHI